MNQDNSNSTLKANQIFTTWWPLALSWLLMSAELPALSAVVARLPHPEINLAAYGGVTFPLALIIESPIIMLLAASTALSKDFASFNKLKRYMHAGSAILTVFHILVVFTPLYGFIARQVLGVPEEIIEPGRIGLIIFIPWTWAIAYRRFHQGMLIRFNRSYTVGAGTLIRLTANGLVLLAGYFLGSLPGVVVASSAVITGVLVEALYVGLAARPVVQSDLRLAPPVSPALTWRAFMGFYIPLVLTTLLTLLLQPIGSAALSRMPLALESLAAWPVTSGLVSLFRSPGTAYNEVVVALLDKPGAEKALRRFSWQMTAAVSLGLLLMSATPLAGWWFGSVSNLRPDLAQMAGAALWLMLPLPGLTVLQSWFQGTLVQRRQTRSITESVVIFLITAVIGLAVGGRWNPAAGLFTAAAAFSLANAAQTVWLWVRARQGSTTH